MKNDIKHYKTIIVGAGAAGLYCACRLSDCLVLEKTRRPGTKLLMAGSGQCNVTHGGSIKDFLGFYGHHGKAIRGVLQRHSNTELCRFLEDMGVTLKERQDGKVFPASMDARDVLSALLDKAKANGNEIRYSQEVESIELSDSGYVVHTEDTSYACTNLVVATGGCSYPTTGSDGKMLEVLARDLGLKIVTPTPALTPVYVENYPFEELSGITFAGAALSIFDTSGKKVHQATGDLLLTLKNFSGPMIINNSRHIKAGMTIELNFMGNITEADLVGKFKRDFPGNDKSPQGYLSEDLGLPKRFAKLMADSMDISRHKVSQLGGAEMKTLAKSMAARRFIVSGIAGFKEAMVTAGGVDLAEIDLKTMEAKHHTGLFLIGEVVDVDGDTGGYNLQFAYSSACAAADKINSL